MIDKQRLKDAKAGNIQEQVSIGKYYYFGAWGLGENIDYKKALFWLTKAAEQGHVESQHSVGFMHYEGQGTQIDYETAFHWYTKAAEQGYTPSQNNLGCLYRDGRGVAECPVISVRDALDVHHVDLSGSYRGIEHRETDYCARDLDVYD